MFSSTNKQNIEHKLQQHLKPSFLEIIDESYLHSNHNVAAAQGGTHFKVKISSSEFSSLSLIEAHRRINKILKAELNSYIHALSIEII